MTDNELIAEFMEVKKGPFGGLHYPQFIYMESYSGWRDEPSHYEYKSEYKPDKLKYSTSWDWLMPVVEKIKTIPMPSQQFGLPYQYLHLDRMTIFTTIETVYRGVVQFIKWYNINEKPKP